jgi:hypothetical protein
MIYAEDNFSDFCTDRSSLEGVISLLFKTHKLNIVYSSKDNYLVKMTDKLVMFHHYIFDDSIGLCAVIYKIDHVLVIEHEWGYSFFSASEYSLVGLDLEHPFGGEARWFFESKNSVTQFGLRFKRQDGLAVRSSCMVQGDIYYGYCLIKAVRCLCPGIRVNEQTLAGGYCD